MFNVYIALVISTTLMNVTLLLFINTRLDRYNKMDGRTDGRMKGSTDGWKDGWTDLWGNGWMNG